MAQEIFTAPHSSVETQTATAGAEQSTNYLHPLVLVIPGRKLRSTPSTTTAPESIRRGGCGKTRRAPFTEPHPLEGSTGAQSFKLKPAATWGGARTLLVLDKFRDAQQATEPLHPAGLFG